MVRTARQHRGEAAYHDGLAAEQIVARHYHDRGLHEARRRWRGPAGEIDLIFQDGNALVFVEVKKARSHDEAALRLSGRQLERIRRSAECYLGSQPFGSLTECRIDLALVDAFGRVAVIENASQY